MFRLLNRRSPRPSALLLVTFMVIGLVLAQPFIGRAFAQEVPCVPPCQPNQTCPAPDCPNPPQPTYALQLTDHSVDVTITDQIATTHLKQTYVNNSDQAVEGSYYFPLPPGSKQAISGFTMTVDGQKLEAQILDANDAKNIYQNYVNQHRDPALLQYTGDDAFQANLYPIPAHGQRIIELEYTMALPQQANGLVQYTYPLGASRLSNAMPASASVTVKISSKDPLRAIYSPSHQVGISQRDEHGATVSFQNGSAAEDTDFVLDYSVSSAPLSANLISYLDPSDPSGSNGYFVLLLTPPTTAASDKVVNKDVILVIDISGSMAGEKIAQARAALQQVLGKLNQGDRFAVLAFDDQLDPYSSGLLPASKAADAQAWVGNLESRGGTDINQALGNALDTAAQNTDQSRPQMVIFLTDGQPTSGVTDLNQISANVKQKAAATHTRIFTFGVGDDVNAVLLDKLANDNGGASAYIRPGEDVEAAVSSFYAQVSQPLLTNVSIDWGQSSVSELYPQPLPDLFIGSQVVLTGRYSNPGAATVTVSGVVNGQQQSYQFANLDFAGPNSTALNPAAIYSPRLWATRKVGYLLSQIRQNGENQELVSEVVNLSTRYGILTPYTSFLVSNDSDVFNPQGLTDATNQFSNQIQNAPSSGSAGVAQSQANNSLRSAQSAPMAMSATATVAGQPGYSANNTQASAAPNPVRRRQDLPASQWGAD
jgi:Ca-activated chloride channel homolog